MDHRFHIFSHSLFLSLNEIEKYHGILDHFMQNIPQWEAYCDTPDPHNQPLPEPWNKKLNSFEVKFFIGN